MPELPDLQVFSRNLDKKLAGKRLSKLKLVVKKNANVKATQMSKALEGKKLKKVYREGKQLRFAFSNGEVLGMHLMLHGQLSLFQDKNESKYPIMELSFDDGTGLALSDYQKKAKPILDPEEGDAPDALSGELNFRYLKSQLAKKRTAVKKFLMDQDIIRGIGNAYADEILWKGRLSPFSICNKIPDNKIKDLLRSIRSVLKDAEKQIILEDPAIISGERRDFLKIHNARKKKSPTGKAIRHTNLGSRITYYTTEQELFE